MIERMNPPNAPKPASNYAQAIVHDAGAKRLIISGQVGVTVDGKTVEGLEAQLRQCWLNLFAVLEGCGFSKEQLVRTVIYVTVPDAVGTSRKVRDEMLGGLAVTSTYLQVAGLASAVYLCEIEGEAVKG